MSSHPSLSALATPGSGAVPRPPTRWIVRVVLPAVIVLAVVGLIAYSARSALVPGTPVWVVPVVAKPGAGLTAAASGQTNAAARTLITQAPGWIEPDPYA